MAFVAAITNGETPLNVLQLLWVNLIMDSLAALGALAVPSHVPRCRSASGGVAAVLIEAAALCPPASAGHRGPHARPANQEAARPRRAAHQQAHVALHPHAGLLPGGRCVVRRTPRCTATVWPNPAGVRPAQPTQRSRPQVFWLFLIFYGMPSQLPRYAVPSQCDYFTATAATGYCCPLPMTEASTPQCYASAGGYWFASKLRWHARAPRNAKRSAACTACAGAALRPRPWSPPARRVADETVPSCGLEVSGACQFTVPTVDAFCGVGSTTCSRYDQVNAYDEQASRRRCCVAGRTAE